MREVVIEIECENDCFEAHPTQELTTGGRLEIGTW
jgi:hypothetical protein